MANFKRIGEIVAQNTGEVFLNTDEVFLNGLQLSNGVMVKLQRKQVELEQSFGFVPTLEQTIAYLLRDVPAALTEPEWHALVKDHMRAGQKIHAIKVVREKTGMGLREAKEFVEDKWTSLLPSNARPIPRWPSDDDN